MRTQELNPYKLENQEDIFYRFNAFTKDQLDELVNYIKETVKPHYDDGVDPRPEEYIVNRKAWDIRPDNSHITQNFHKRLGEITKEANKKFGFDLDYLQQLKYFEYKESNNNLDWHTDIGLHQSMYRKLSFTIMVTDNYKGGRLEMYIDQNKYQVPSVIGGMAAFPSFMPHRVTKIKKGMRGVIVGMWAGNRPYR